MTRDMRRLAGVPVRTAEQAAPIAGMLAEPRSVHACDGCAEPGADERLWLEGPLGLSAVHVHRDRDCAQRARVARGRGRYVSPAGEGDQPLPVRNVRDEGLLAACQEYAVEWRRTHSTERVGP